VLHLPVQRSAVAAGGNSIFRGIGSGRSLALLQARVAAANFHHRTIDGAYPDGNARAQDGVHLLRVSRRRRGGGGQAGGGDFVVSANPGAVFLSYASQDSAVARRIADALRAAGIEVWFDQSELRGGEAGITRSAGRSRSAPSFCR